MKKILWLSRHEPLSRQVDELRRIFGEVDLRKDVRPFESAERIAEQFHRGGYDEIVIVAPLSVIAKLTELGIRPLWAEMETLPGPAGADLEFRGRYYRFVEFRRIARVAMEFTDI